MSPYDLQVLRERVDNATPGPWEEAYPYAEPGRVELFIGHTGEHIDFGTNSADVEFIVAARSDVPALLDHIEWHQRQFKRVLDGLKEHSSRLFAVLELHSPVGWPDQYCQHCEHNYPCPTKRAAERKKQ